MNSWRMIWNNRQPARRFDLADLIKLNGFDGDGTSFTPDAWLQYIATFQTKIPIDPSDSIFEFGCGCGAFLMPFYEKGHEVGGVDYSEVLISVARTNMINAELRLQNVNEPCGAKFYDIVVSHSVFHYFESYDFARIICRNMIQKSSKKVAILDVPNMQLKKESERARALAQTSDGARRIRNDVRHLYFKKEWFEKVAKDEKVDIEIIDQAVEGYVNSRYRYNVIMSK